MLTLDVEKILQHFSYRSTTVGTPLCNVPTRFWLWRCSSSVLKAL